MDLKEHFNQIMGESVNMALATGVAAGPNVRVVTFAYSPEKPGRVFFTTFNGSRKTKEFAENPRVACMPLPESPEADVQVRLFGRVQKSDVGMDEVVALIARKFPGGADTVKEGGPMMDIYEVCVDEAYVAVGMNPDEKIAF
ncbi:MAG TPA: hypothetical protein DEB31_04880 [Clostridiales bacterium]|nr:hypothetical protein [Clostridiales bacterium]